MKQEEWDNMSIEEQNNYLMEKYSKLLDQLAYDD